MDVDVDVAAEVCGGSGTRCEDGEARSEKDGHGGREVTTRREAGGDRSGEKEAVRGRWVVAGKTRWWLGRLRARAPISAAALPTSVDSADEERQTR